ncbi:MAG TPA: S53 family peptidase [Mycobacteriales bacterium]
MSRPLALKTVTAVGLTAAVIAALAGVAPDAHAAATAAGGETALPNSTPRWMSHAQATTMATPDAGTRQSVTVYLAPKGGLAALQAKVLALSTPGSASYRHFLTPDQYYAAYSPAAAAVSSVTSWLANAGLSVTGTDAHNDFVTATGTRSALQQAFGVSLRGYRHDGQSVVAPDGPTYVPSNLAGTVLAVGGLDTTTFTSTTQTSGDGPAATNDALPPAFVNARPCSLSYGSVTAKYQADYQTKLPKFDGAYLPYAVCGYTGPQFRAAYEGGATEDGSGVTVGIIDAYASPTIAKDAQTYATDHGDGSYAAGQLTQTTASKFTHKKLCGPTGWYGEETLDVEAVHAMAPSANIRYFGAASCENNDLLASARQAVRQDKVDLISNSYGDTEQDASADYVAASEQVFLQGAAQGIGFLFSSGDDGDELAATGIKQADYQTSDPFVTSVGGTATAIGADGKIEFQTGWGTDKYSLATNGKDWTPVGYLYGSGGGYSALFNRPPYQDGAVSNSARGVPDVAMDADPTTGMLVGETQQFPDGAKYGEYRIGGTSLASPLFAGMTALRVQAAGGRLGFLNPSIYAAPAGTFTDVKGQPADAGNVRVDYVNGVDASDGLVYSVRTFNDDASLQVAKGWDDVTGVGVPSPAWITAPAS